MTARAQGALTSEAPQGVVRPGPRGGEIALALCCPPVTAGGQPALARLGSGGPGLSLRTWSVPIRTHLLSGSRGYVHSEVTHNDTSLSSRRLRQHATPVTRVSQAPRGTPSSAQVPPGRCCPGTATERPTDRLWGPHPVPRELAGAFASDISLRVQPGD